MSTYAQSNSITYVLQKANKSDGAYLQRRENLLINFNKVDDTGGKCEIGLLCNERFMWA